MKNYTKYKSDNKARIELHDNLNLTGAEISINELPANASVPFIHSHKENEEIYFILSGTGKAVIDDDDVILQSGDWLRIHHLQNANSLHQIMVWNTYVSKYVKIH